MKPRLRHKLVRGLFGKFITDYFYLFNETFYEAGNEFISDFVTNIQAKVFLPDENIITYGNPVYEMVMIQESVVSCHCRIDKPRYYRYEYEELSEENLKTREPQFTEFFILPTYSFFGDFQILYDLKS